MNTNSAELPGSRYVSGGKTEANTNALEWWERTKFTLDDSDTRYVVDRKSAGRLDLIAYAAYGDSHLWWFIAQYNALLDPFAEVTEGRVLRIPAKDRVQLMMTTGKLGGYPSAREVPINNITPIV
jgi:nucleoid-associated protein YgaU